MKPAGYIMLFMMSVFNLSPIDSFAEPSDVNPVHMSVAYGVKNIHYDSFSVTPPDISSADNLSTTLGSTADIRVSLYNGWLGNYRLYLTSGSKAFPTGAFTNNTGKVSFADTVAVTIGKTIGAIPKIKIEKENKRSQQQVITPFVNAVNASGKVFSVNQPFLLKDDVIKVSAIWGVDPRYSGRKAVEAFEGDEGASFDESGWSAGYGAVYYANHKVTGINNPNSLLVASTYEIVDKTLAEFGFALGYAKFINFGEDFSIGAGMDASYGLGGVSTLKGGYYLEATYAPFNGLEVTASYGGYVWITTDAVQGTILGGNSQVSVISNNVASEAILAINYQF